MAFTPDEIKQIEEIVTKVLKTSMPTILQPVQSLQIKSQTEILSAVKNHGASNLQTLLRRLGK